jgi:hypothetical protein
MTPTRDELLITLRELCEEADGQRFGQLVANLATLARGADPSAMWDAEDDEMLAAARRLLTHYRQRQQHVA